MKALESNLPAGPGRYVLVARLPAPTLLRTDAGRTFSLPSGVYAYVGSACGPGGLRARLRRYLCGSKARHWHIDYLLTEASPLGVLCTSVAVEECSLAQLMATMEGAQPIYGFGCSDCRCASHLYLLGRYRGIHVLACALVDLARHRGYPLEILCWQHLDADES